MPDHMKSVTGFVIDSATTHDHDDAILLTPCGGEGFIVTVCISDVAQAIAVGSDVDKQARELAFTRYYAKGEDAMLPRYWSHNQASLLPQKDRGVVQFEVLLDTELSVQDVNIADCSVQYAKGIYLPTD